ncbi:hypothetical protein [Spirosoma agri]|uniref:Uncharacterized protein n=1 Tax=Spirosoma agri TaxID=1987381 RepID=A0A6M0IMF2_9BACT|nr:hypothetical protein [Spirosoma agri]NEU68083.1 hypothetical protein [Spirosoma agri]
MTHLTRTLTAVTKLAFVADAYPYKNDDTIVVVLKPALRDNLPLNRSLLTFEAADFTVAAVVEAYEREIVRFLADTLRTAEQLLASSTSARIIPIAPFCLN